MRFSFSLVCAALASLVLLVTTSHLASCAEVGLNFTAQVTLSFPSNPTYGMTFPIGTVMSGHLVYESNTPSYSISSEYCADCTAYNHKQINGLRVEFPGLTMQADEYIIQFQNDVNVSSVGEADVLSVLYPDQNDPSGIKLGKPLLINGSPVSAGSFRIDLVALPTTFTNSQLPATIDPSVFIPSAGVSVFGDGVPGYNALDMFLKPTSVSAFPHSTSDHDLDGDVDGADFLIWQRHAGAATGNGDADSNLLVNQDDLALWEAEYAGSLGGLAANVAVPEPSGIALMLGVGLIALCRL